MGSIHQVIVETERERWMCREVLKSLVTEGMNARANAGISGVVGKARSLFLETIEEFGFEFHRRMKKQLLGHFLWLNLAFERWTLILLETGRG